MGLLHPWAVGVGGDPRLVRALEFFWCPQHPDSMLSEWPVH